MSFKRYFRVKTSLISRETFTRDAKRLIEKHENASPPSEQTFFEVFAFIGQHSNVILVPEPCMRRFTRVVIDKVKEHHAQPRVYRELVRALGLRFCRMCMCFTSVESTLCRRHRTLWVALYRWGLPMCLIEKIAELLPIEYRKLTILNKNRVPNIKLHESLEHVPLYPQASGPSSVPCFRR